MSGLSNLGTGLTVVFLVCLLLLLAEISYVFWCRRRFRQQNATVESDASGEPYSTSTTTTTTTTTTSSSPSKELIYFFCWKKQSRIEPATAPTAPATTDQENPSLEIDNPLKWHVLYGQSRLLFTIKEEDREDLESEKSSSAERNPNPINPKRKRVSLGDCFEITKEEPPVESLETETETETVSVVLDVENLQTESTPFMTPCASPSSGSPSPSPPSVAGENKRVEGLQLA